VRHPLSILLVGESWFTYTIHQKGFDAFQTAEYTEGAADFVARLRGAGHEVDYIPAHRVSHDFPAEAAGLRRFDVVLLSDVGSNTFLLSPETFGASRINPNRLEALREYVGDGGALLMIGGYMSFAGIDGKARYGSSPLAEVMPVEVLPVDDRVEVPEGFSAQVLAPHHPAIAGASPPWPPLPGYNRVLPREETDVLVERGGDPIVAVGSYGEGRAGVFTSDLAPHWAPPEFVTWSGYLPLWESLLGWLAGSATSDPVESVPQESAR
jgi:uncharacterized membrane protein